MRILSGIASLRVPALFEKVREALAEGQARFGFRLVHFSVQSNHVHLIAEAGDRRSLSRGMQGVSIRVARAVNRELVRSGRVFADRYHARVLKTPREVRMALRYVLLNSRKHARTPQGSAAAAVKSMPFAGFVDGCSSAPWFAEFERPTELAFGVRAARAGWEREHHRKAAPVVAPQTWLLRIGWKRAGRFDVDDVPGVPGL